MFVNFHLTLWGGDLGRLWALGWLWLQGAQPLKSSSLAWTAPKRNPAETERSTFSVLTCPLPFQGLLIQCFLPTPDSSSLALPTHLIVFTRNTQGRGTQLHQALNLLYYFLLFITFFLLYFLISSMVLLVFLKIDPDDWSLFLGLLCISDSVVCLCCQTCLVDSPWIRESICWRMGLILLNLWFPRFPRSDCSAVGGIPDLLQAPWSPLP